MSKKQKNILFRVCIAGIGLLLTHLTPLPTLPKAALSFGIYFLIGFDILRKALRGIGNRQVFDENFLMAIATVGAITLAIYQKSYDFTEAIAVMLFYQIGQLFEHYAVGKSRKSISSLMDIRPDYANMMQDGMLHQVDPETVAVGSEIIVQPGEKIPIDGIVLSGHSALDTSALTGESLPRDVAEGEAVISGCINLTGVLTIRTTRNFAESTVSKIMELVELSASRKARSEKFIAKFSRVYTPAVCLGALALALLPPVTSLLLGRPGHWDIWVYRALTFLVISCPCALVISIPLSFFAGIGGASREGILIKGANYLETMAKAKTVVLDKTGTLTLGVFQVAEIFPHSIAPETLLEYAALAECASSHPIAKGIHLAYGKALDRGRVSDIREVSGYGVTAIVDGTQVIVGSHKLMADLDIHGHERSGTVVHVALNGSYGGHIVLTDTVKPAAKSAISQLRTAGITKTVMLTGDNKAVADAVADTLGIGQVYSELLPGDKVAKVEELLAKRPGELVFVGDGINDAPVLSRADVGIAMGGIGSDAAIEAADVVLMDDDPAKIAKAIRISRRCISIVYQNIFLALGIKFACLALGATGLANMWFAIFADVGVMVLAVLNAIRALNARSV